MKSLGYLFILFYFLQRKRRIWFFLEALTKAGGEEEATQYFLFVLPHQLSTQIVHAPYIRFAKKMEDLDLISVFGFNLIKGSSIKINLVQ